MSSIPRVALLIETSNNFGRGLIRGVANFIRESSPWSLYLREYRRGEPVPRWLQTWDGDGIIARVENENIAKMVLDLDIPTVNVSQTDLTPKISTVMVDETEIVRLAADHLLERGFKTFGFFDAPANSWTVVRQRCFSAYLEERGYPCHVYKPSARAQNWDKEQADVAKWLGSLPTPLGLMAAYDLRGQQLLDACRRIGVAVPEEVAVIGSGNDEVLCDVSWPPLTSVIVRPEESGYEAASVLRRLMAGKVAAGEKTVIRPVGVYTRQSTETQAIGDKQVVESLRMIREMACDDIHVSDLVERSGQSRRKFEQQFKNVVGRSPHAEIVRVQLERVKQLLIETELPLAKIAEIAGFKHTEYLSVVFKNKVGTTPSSFRSDNGQKA